MDAMERLESWSEVAYAAATATAHLPSYSAHFYDSSLSCTELHSKHVFATDEFKQLLGYHDTLASLIHQSLLPDP